MEGSGGGGREFTLHAATEEKHYPCDNQTTLKLPFQPIAIVCQLHERVIGAFSLTGDLCEYITKSLQAQST